MRMAFHMLEDGTPRENRSCSKRRMAAWVRDDIVVPSCMEPLRMVNRSINMISSDSLMVGNMLGPEHNVISIT